MTQAKANNNDHGDDDLNVKILVLLNFQKYITTMHDLQQKHEHQVQTRLYIIDFKKKPS